LSGRKGQLGEHVSLEDVETAIGPVLALEDLAERWKERLESAAIVKERKERKARKVSGFPRKFGGSCHNFGKFASESSSNVGNFLVVHALEVVPGKVRKFAPIH